MSAPPYNLPRRRSRAVVSLALVIVLAGGAAACGAKDEKPDAAPAKVSPRRTTVRPPTTKRQLSQEALDEFDRAVADSNSPPPPPGTSPSTTTTARPAASSTTSTASKQSTTSTGASTTTTADDAPPPPALTAEDCRLFSQLIVFTGNLWSQVDPDPQVTAQRVAEVVARSKSGLDQLQAIAPDAIKGSVDSLIAWARGLAVGSAVDSAAAQAAFDNLRTWYNANCG